MGYYIDLEAISIDSYKAKIEAAYLPPGRKLLKERTDERFGFFTSFGITNVKQLLQTLRKKDKFNELSKAECYTGNYLTILLRELNSILPKPIRIRDFPGISSETVANLEKTGINDTLKLFDQVKSAASRKELADATGITHAEIMELTKLTDLSRIKWVGGTFARILYDIGADTVENVSKANIDDLHHQINQINEEGNYCKGQIGLNDVRIVVDAAKELPLEIEFEQGS
ncbi:MAG: DUF4332 domain-containing protein [Bacteroidota bacterium]